LTLLRILNGVTAVLAGSPAGVLLSRSAADKHHSWCFITQRLLSPKSFAVYRTSACHSTLYSPRWWSRLQV